MDVGILQITNKFLQYYQTEKKSQSNETAETDYLVFIILPVVATRFPILTYKATSCAYRSCAFKL